MRMLLHIWFFAALSIPAQAHEGSSETHSEIERVLRAFHSSFTEAKRDSMALKETIAPTFTAINMQGSADPQQWIPAYAHLRRALGAKWHPNVDYENELTILKVHVHRGVATVVVREVGRNANSSWEAVNAYTLIYDDTWRLTSLAMNAPSQQQERAKRAKTLSSSHSKVLDVKPAQAFTRAVGALQPVLQAAGASEWSVERLHGVLGNSFSFEMRKGGGKVWQEANLEWWNTLPALELGIPVRRIQGNKDDDLTDVVEAAWDAVRASIERGVPVVALCPMSPELGVAHDWGLLVGYDMSDKTYTVRRRHEDFQVKYDEIVYSKFCVLVYDPTKKVDAAKVNAQALRNAVAFAKGTRFTPEGYSYPVDARGFAALELWRDDVASGTPIREQHSPKSKGFYADSRYNANELRFIRHHAAAYCRELIVLFPSAAVHLEEAASHYDRVSAVASRLGLVFQRAEDGGLLGADDRVEASGLISKALEAEREAIDSIEAALAQISN